MDKNTHNLNNTNKIVAMKYMIIDKFFNSVQCNMLI